MATPREPALLALDWGTSSLRAYLLGGPDEVVASRNAPWGIMHLPEGGYVAALESLCGDWLQAHPALPILASGMVGSAQGWREAPYVHTPASAEALAQGLAWVEGPGGRRIGIVPGVMQDGMVPNVMRGEEVQVVGAWPRAAEHAGAGRSVVMVLPGTHSKWALVREGRIESFTTCMTGEVFAVLRTHSILGRLMQPSETMDVESFERGLSQAQEDGSGLLSSLFSVRTLGLTQRLQPQQLGDYLSGLLIGHELRESTRAFAAHLDPATPLILIGAEDLCRRYRLALSHIGLQANTDGYRDATPAGLWEVARMAGLVTTPEGQQ